MDNKGLLIGVGVATAAGLVAWHFIRPPVKKTVPPVIVAPPQVKLVATKAQWWSFAPNPTEPSYPGKRIILIGGNQALSAKVGGLVQLANTDASKDTGAFTVEVDVLIGNQVLKKANSFDGNGVYPYSGPGSYTSKVGPISLAPNGNLMLAFVADIAYTDALVGQISIHATVKSAAGVVIATGTSYIPLAYVLGDVGAKVFGMTAVRSVTR
jgi:hypothetical protein